MLLNEIWVRIAAVGTFILALFLGYRYITRRSYNKGVAKERQENLVNSYEALKASNEAEREFKGIIDDEENIPDDSFNRVDFVWESDSPSEGNK